MSRYAQLDELIDMFRPRTIVEVGVHRGKRSVAMCERALLHRDDVVFNGYDMFEEMTPEIGADEMLGTKRPCPLEYVDDKLKALTKRWPNFQHVLVQGNTRRTLHGKHIVADFAFIDGGHSVETIRGDFDALKLSTVIVFDDYFVAGADTSKYGCNEVIAPYKHTVLPFEDQFGPLKIRMAMILGGFNRPEGEMRD